MTGPQHYAEAERLLSKAQAEPDPVGAQTALAAALVHAQLAQVAAFVDPWVESGELLQESRESDWAAVVR